MCRARPKSPRNPDAYRPDCYVVEGEPPDKREKYQKQFMVLFLRRARIAKRQLDASISMGFDLRSAESS